MIVSVVTLMLAGCAWRLTRPRKPIDVGRVTEKWIGEHLRDRRDV